VPCPPRARPPLRFPWPTDARGGSPRFPDSPPPPCPRLLPPPPPPSCRPPRCRRRRVDRRCRCGRSQARACSQWGPRPPPARRCARGSSCDARGVATSILCHCPAACTRTWACVCSLTAAERASGVGDGTEGWVGVGGCVWACVGVCVCVCCVCVCVCRTVLAPPVGDPTGRRRVICRTWSARGRRGGRRDAITPPAAVPALALPPLRVTVADALARTRAAGGGARPEGAPAASAGAAGSLARAGGYNSPLL